MTDKIKSALARLDHSKDEDWTEGGLPSMDRIKALTGDNTITRADVAAADGKFQRQTGEAKRTAPAAQKAGEADQPKGGRTGNPDDLKPAEVPGDRPLDEQGLGNPNDAANNAEERNSEDIDGKIDDPEYHSADVTEDAGAIAKRYGDPIMLLEAAMLAAGSGRYARNSELQSLLRGYQTAQRGIKEVQARHDARIADREERQDRGAVKQPSQGSTRAA